MILDLGDENWRDVLVDDEYDIIGASFNRSRPELPEDMTTFLNAIPDSSDINVLFNHLDVQPANPSNQRGLLLFENYLAVMSVRNICLPVIKEKGISVVESG